MPKPGAKIATLVLLQHTAGGAAVAGTSVATAKKNIHGAAGRFAACPVQVGILQNAVEVT
jgi:hypothetical protein